MKIQVVIIHFLAVLGIVAASPSPSAPAIIQQPQSVTVNVGEPASFDCAFQNPVGDLTMMIDGFGFTLDDLKSYDPRYYVTSNVLPGKNHFVGLTISNTTWEDETTYQCQMFNGRTKNGTLVEKLQTDVVNLTLNHFWKPPKILKQNEGKLATVAEVLVCETETYPEPEIKWIDQDGNRYGGTSSNVTMKSREKQKDGNPIMEPRFIFKRNSTLIITSEMYSKYLELNISCVVTVVTTLKDGSKQIRTRTDTLGLSFWKERPEINLVEASTGFSSSSKTLRCSATCVPNVTIDWTHPTGLRTSEIYNTDRKKFNLTNTPRVDGILSTLEIFNFNSSDIGYYTCKVTNEFGDASESVYVDVDGGRNIMNGFFAHFGTIALSVVCGIYLLVTVVLVPIYLCRSKSPCNRGNTQNKTSKAKHELGKDSGSIMDLPLPPVSFPYQDSLPRRFNEYVHLEGTFGRGLSPIPEEINNLNTETGSPATIVEDLNLSFTSSTFSPIQQAIQKLDTDYSPVNVTSPLFFNCALDRSTTSSVSDNEVSDSPYNSQ